MSRRLRWVRRWAPRQYADVWDLRHDHRLHRGTDLPQRCLRKRSTFLPCQDRALRPWLAAGRSAAQPGRGVLDLEERGAHGGHHCHSERGVAHAGRGSVEEPLEPRDGGRSPFRPVPPTSSFGTPLVGPPPLRAERDRIRRGIRLHRNPFRAPGSAALGALRAASPRATAGAPTVRGLAGLASSPRRGSCARVAPQARREHRGVQPRAIRSGPEGAPRAPLGAGRCSAVRCRRPRPRGQASRAAVSANPFSSGWLEVRERQLVGARRARARCV